VGTRGGVCPLGSSGWGARSRRTPSDGTGRGAGNVGRDCIVRQEEDIRALVKNPVAAVINHKNCSVGSVSSRGNSKAGDIDVHAEAALDGGGPGRHKKSICYTSGGSVEVAESRWVTAK